MGARHARLRPFSAPRRWTIPESPRGWYGADRRTRQAGSPTSSRPRRETPAPISRPCSSGARLPKCTRRIVREDLILAEGISAGGCPPARNGGSDRFRPNGSIASEAAMRDLRTQGLDRVRAALAAQRHRRLAPASPPWRRQTGTDMKPFRRSRETIRKQTALRKEAHRRRQSPSGGPHEPFHSLC